MLENHFNKVLENDKAQGEPIEQGTASEMPPSQGLGKGLVLFIGIAVVYCISGRLALLLAIPPGYATAVWPAAGVGLAGVLLFGYRYWPAVFIGSFFVNIWTGFDSTSIFTILKSLGVAAGIGLGAALQAVTGAYFIRRFVGYPSRLVKEKGIALFLGLGGPVSCLINATVGVVILCIAGINPWTNFFFGWWTWWIGDAIGVILVLPVILIWVGEPRSVWRERKVNVVLPTLAAFAIAVLFFIYASRQEQAKIQHELELEANVVVNSFKENISRYVNQLYAIKSFFASSQEVTRDKFRRFTNDSFTLFPGLKGLSWIKVLPDAERDAYEESIRQNGFPGFHVTELTAQEKLIPAAKRPEYLVVSYVEPFEVNKLAMGIDVASNPIRLEAINRARHRDEPAMTRQITLVTESKNPPGLLIFLPVYPHDSFPSIAQEKPFNLAQGMPEPMGYVVAALQITNFVEASLKSSNLQNVEFRFYDETALADKQLLYSSAQKESDIKGFQAFEWVDYVEMAGRRLKLIFTPTLEYLAAKRSWQAWGAVTASLLFIGLFQAFLLVITGRTVRVSEIVTQRTFELSKANGSLQKEIVEHKRAEEDLKEAMAFKSEFTSMVSRELHTPLTAIKEGIGIVGDESAGPLNDEQKEFLELATRNLDRLTWSINSALDLQKIDSGETDVKVGRENVKSIAR